MLPEKIYISLRRLYIKIFSWEYWPMYVVYFPVSIYYIYLAAKARSFFFFSASNPTIETGGMFFESKMKIFELIPKELYPATIYIEEKHTLEQILNIMSENAIAFPVIAKPDRGERGWCVQKIENDNELVIYKAKNKIPFLIQAFVSYDLEFSVFYCKNPSEKIGRVTSVTFKKLLSIVGDGMSTVDELIKKDNRAFLQYHTLKNSKSIDFKMILPKGVKQILVPYGNHVRGAEFLDYNHIIEPQLTNTFDNISKRINGFYYGRFDLRCTSIEDLIAGKNIQILELNGAGAEPAHIYDPKFSFIKAQQVLANHYKLMYDIAIHNKKKGVNFMTLRQYKALKKEEKIFKMKAA